MTSQERGRWQQVEWPPHPKLSGIVQGYRGFALDLTRPVLRLEFPVPFVTLTITWRGTLKLTAGSQRPVQLRQLVAGITTEVVRGEHNGHLEGVDLRLWPLGAYRLFDGIGAARDSHILTLADVMGAGAAELTERLAECPNWATRFAVLDEVLLARAAGGREPCARTAAAWRRVQSEPAVSVSVLAADVGWSERHLQSRFRGHFGATPKGAQRIVRLQRALRALDVGQSAIDAAALAGYFDQAHLIREVKAMTGLTPAALARHRAMGWRPSNRSQTEITSVLVR